MFFAGKQVVGTLLLSKIEDSGTDRGRYDEFQTRVTKHCAVRKIGKVFVLNQHGLSLLKSPLVVEATNPIVLISEGCIRIIEPALVGKGEAENLVGRCFLLEGQAKAHEVLSVSSQVTLLNTVEETER